MDLKRLWDVVTKFKVGLTRGGVWFSVVTIPFIFVREVQAWLLESWGISLPLGWIVAGCVVGLIVVCVFDYLVILPRENALIWTNNSALKDGKFKD